MKHSDRLRAFEGSDALGNGDFSACNKAADALDMAEEALQTASDLLAERIYGNPARSPGHNARVVMEAALTKLLGSEGEE